ncbi:MAG: hypothetical protein EAZ61_02425 [Oscillatoriales cyanobacterium]|nr:MAG: hypothetical protein EAZ61_02425 [Oscillatoriales cyanobacterium]
MKKQLLTAFTSLALLASAIAVPATATIFGSGDDAASIDANSQLSDLYDDFGGDSGSANITVDDMQGMMMMMLSMEVGVSALDLLQDPSKVDYLNDAGEAVKSGSGEVPHGFGVISKEGCTADIGCAIGAAGIKVTLVCLTQVPAKGGSLADAEDIANCMRDVDYDRYMAASACTYGTCPGFASIGQDDLYACNTDADADVMALFN